ncbi:MAG TPA: thiamine pyrophosphate-dependent dehydrogenase E1 component subunit alpha [Chloroflexota bacterium]
MSARWSGERLLGLYRGMYLIRRFEERCLELSRKGLIPGSVHLCVGQEAVAVGAADALRPDDLTVTTYRGHGHELARGIDLRAAMAELLGRRTGLCKGRGGSMHLTDISHGVLPPNSIVGGGLPIATGAALAQMHQGRDRVVLCTFGEGTLNQGGAHEALNLAAIWNLPVIFLCENNQYSEMTPAYQMIKGDSFAPRVAAYGMPTHTVDGMDAQAVAEAVAPAVARARAGAGPSYVEADTYRFLGHYQGDPGTGYRPAEEIARWRERDPLPRLAESLAAQPGFARRLEAEEQAVEEALGAAQQAALEDPWPSRDEIEEGLYAAG